MKPDWNDAPDWAQWLAMDKDGTWWWFEREPGKGGVSWGGWGQLDSCRCVEAFGHQIHGKLWSQSLERRP
jgi:hypothetical protein